MLVIEHFGDHSSLKASQVVKEADDEPVEFNIVLLN
ncbi:hypothetical protein LF1_11600 [Rubripirellula obstinata]|uniref:Uncharacterized protein n=1 Tax=Rubripirellula obstinata TaxID=406547 RepID=A0A5B1CBU2_9BACT|nr:hypothetical protein LF1_11600 [Rubripirellula obstinata]